MATTSRTILDEVKLALNDSGNDFMSDTEYKRYIFKHLISDSNTYAFQSRVSGSLWTYSVGREYWFYGGSFTEESACDYNYYPNGSIELTSGTDTRSSIDVTATLIDFPELILDICQTLLLHRSKEASSSIGGASYTPPDEARIREVMEIWRGIIAI